MIPTQEQTARCALRYGRDGWRVLPVRAGDKIPVLAGWPERASAEPSAIEGWFASAHNIGVACGPQPNGVNLVVLDVDGNTGLASLRALIGAHGPLPDTAVHETASGGLHYFFDAGVVEVRNSASQLAPGLDIRGSGGQVVVPPSWRPNGDGEPTLYRAAAHQSSLWHRPVLAIPAWLLELILKPTAVTNGHVPVPDAGGDWADWLRSHWDWEDVLTRRGHTVTGRSGGFVYFKHPTATSEHSARFGADGRMCAWSTNMPAALRSSQVGSDGSVSWSPWDWFVATECGGSTREAARRVDVMRGVAGPVQRAPHGPGWQDSGGQTSALLGDTVALNLPSGFWSQRSVLGHILTAARAAACSPDALLVHALARSATFLHPCFKLPGVEQGLIGKQQTVDFLGCVVAETSGGKTLAAGIGELLVPAPDPPSDGSDPMIDFEQKVGSGEGIAEFFLVPELREDEDGKLKPTGRRVVGKQALFMNVDEGTGFTNQAARRGTTIISTLASAWSGESLGQLNANSETRRLVQGGRVRICAVINMQDSNGFKLYADDLESVGFTGRLLFATAHDDEAPAVRPSWPGRLGFPVWPGGISNKFFSYDPPIVDEIHSTRHAILTRKMQIDRRQSQYLLLRCKVAALLAMWEDRMTVTVSDWALATDVIGASARVLSHLDLVRSLTLHDLAVTTATSRKVVDREAEDNADRRFVATKVVELRRYIPAEGIAPSKLRKRLKSTQRDLWNAIFERALADGVWRVDGERIFVA